MRADTVNDARTRIRRVIRGIERKLRRMHHEGALNRELVTLASIDLDLEKASGGECRKRTRTGGVK